MEKIVDDLKKIEALINYYKKRGLLIVGLNDSQGVNTSSTFFRKGLLEYIASALTSESLNPLVINGFSLTMNKTEHIDYFIKNNVTLEDIKVSQIYSTISALEKVMKDIGLPSCLGAVGNISRLIYKPTEGDKKIKLASALQEAKEPIMIYSSGVNNLMREVGSNPFAAPKDYARRLEEPNYYYTLEKARDPQTLKTVIDSIEKNYETILGVNNDTDIYALGAYTPKSLQTREMKELRELVMAYNEELQRLCKDYNVTFVNTEEIGKQYNKSKMNFHVSSSGHNALGNSILEHIYENKIVSPSIPVAHNYSTEVSDLRNQGVMNALKEDFHQSLLATFEEEGYDAGRRQDIADEHRREYEIFEKVFKYTM